jgi:hypothetical protein
MARARRAIGFVDLRGVSAALTLGATFYALDRLTAIRKLFTAARARSIAGDLARS